jgi:hypothetical protein
LWRGKFCSAIVSFDLPSPIFSQSSFSRLIVQLSPRKTACGVGDYQAGALRYDGHGVFSNAKKIWRYLSHKHGTFVCVLLFLGRINWQAIVLIDTQLSRICFP